MKNIGRFPGVRCALGLFLLSSLLLCRIAGAAVIYSDDFDGFSRDWVCCLADCALDPGVPPGYSEFHSNTLGSNYGECNCQITPDADMGAGGRGLRIYLEEDIWPTGENVLKKDLGEDYRLLYIRWHMRESTNEFGNFEKLFRIKQEAGQILIPEWKEDGGQVRMNLWDANTGNNHLFENFDLKTDVELNRWYCYEMKIDLDAKSAEFWVDGASQGTLTDQPWLDEWTMRNIEIGGNQYGHTWSAPVEYPRDYDNIVIGTEYVGCESIPPPDEEAPEERAERAETAEPVAESLDAPDASGDPASGELLPPDVASDPGDAPGDQVPDAAEEGAGGEGGCGCGITG